MAPVFCFVFRAVARVLSFTARKLVLVPDTQVCPHSMPMPLPMQPASDEEEEFHANDGDDELAGLDEEPAPLPEEHLRRRPRRREEEEDHALLQPVEGPVKRVRRRDDDEEPAQQPSTVPSQPQTEPQLKQEQEQPANPPQSEDQVTAALKRLTSHIGNPSKYLKAAPLLRQLLESGSCTPQHRALVFEAVRAMFSLQPGRYKHLVDATARRETTKLMTLVASLVSSHYFTKSERDQINLVYVPLASVGLSLLTDDSFMFSKAITKLKEYVDALPERDEGGSTEEEVAAYHHVTQDLPGTPPPQAAPEPAPAKNNQSEPAEPGPLPQPTPQPPAPQPPQPPSTEDDPFGLDKLISNDHNATDSTPTDDPFGLGAIMDTTAPPPKPKPAPAAPKPPPPPSTAWNSDQLLAARRCALLTCVQHTRTFHKQTWAQSSIETLVEHVWNNRSRFSHAQQQDIDELWRWVRQARATRKLGPSAKELNRDSTSFERARTEWSKATVSARGKVGSQGDAKAANWLG